MKLIINNLGKILIAIIVVALAILLISTVFVPGVCNFVDSLFPNEVNYIDRSNDSSPLTLSCASADISLALGETVDLFSNVTALSSNNDNLISQLTDDYAKPVADRSHVFIYKINEDKTSRLVSQIDTSVPGKWAVFYLLNDATDSISLKVLYTVN